MGVSTDYKSSNRIELSQLVQDLLFFKINLEVPHLGVGGGWVGHTHTFMCTHTHVKLAKHDTHEGGNLQDASLSVKDLWPLVHPGQLQKN